MEIKHNYVKQVTKMLVGDAVVELLAHLIGGVFSRHGS